MRPLALASSLAATLLAAGCSVFGGQAAPEPEYSVIESAPPFEIREYGALAVAETTATGGYDSALSTGFGRLFDYISGANRGGREIAMTAPVMTAPDDGDGDRPRGEEIAMTAPVLAAPEGGDRWTVRFVLPAGIAAETAPEPTDPAVRIARIPERRVAVVTFSGWFTDEAIAENREKLMAWLADRPERAAGPWQAAGYNPPWTLPWLKRNEVMVPVE